MGPLAGVKILEIAGHRARSVRRHDARRHGRRRPPRRPGRQRASAATRPRRRPTCSTAAGARSASTSRTPTGVEACSTLVEQADALIEGFRPGVAERLGLRPRRVPRPQPALVYGRMTGWGQDGPLRAGRRSRHQLHRPRRARSRPIGRAGEKPDAAAEPRRRLRRWRHAAGLRRGVRRCSRRRRSGEGQVVDAAMVDGAALLMTMFHAFTRHGHLGRRAGHEHARHRRPLLRRLRDAPTASTSRSGRSSRSSTPSCSASPASSRRADCPSR